MDIYSWFKEGFAPAIARLVIKLVAGWLLGAGISTAAVEGFANNSTTYEIIVGLIVAAVGLILSKKNDVKNVTTPPPTVVK